MAGRPRTRRRRERALRASTIGAAQRSPYRGEGSASRPLPVEPSEPPAPPRSFGDFMEDVVERREWRERSAEHALQIRERAIDRRAREQKLRDREFELGPWGGYKGPKLRDPDEPTTASRFFAALQPVEAPSLDFVDDDESMAPQWAALALLAVAGLGFLVRTREAAA